MLPLSKPQATRPASLVIRFSTKDAYDKAVKLYTELLGRSAIASTQRTLISFRVGINSAPEKKDIELRLEWHQGDTTPLKDRTIIYWAIDPKGDEAAAAEIKKRVRELGYNREEKGNDFLDDGSFLLSDDSGNLYGGHPNPPFPPGRSVNFLHLGPVGLGAAGLLAGVLLTWLFVVRPLAARNAELEARR